MDRRKKLKQFVKKAKRHLNMEQMIRMVQYGVFIGFVFSAVILVLSRLFVFPYYRTVAVSVAIGALVLTISYIWWKRMKDKDALHKLDAFYPHNELVTALSFKDDQDPLVDALLTKAEKETPAAFAQFKGRKKELWKPKVWIGVLLTSIVMGLLFIFPSATQQDALMYEKEQDVIQHLKKDVTKLEKKTETKEVKKELQQLQNQLKETKLSEEALREVVKKQKELKLQEQKLKDKKSLVEEQGDSSQGLTTEEQKQLEELVELQNSLAQTANRTQSALSKLGKPVSFDLQTAIASELGTESEANEGEGSSSDSEEKNAQNGEQQQGNHDGETNGQGTGSEGNQSTSSQSGQGQGSSSGSGQGSSSGRGSGNGLGSGSGAGFGQGSRSLLSIPERIGSSSGPTVDGGALSEGKPVAEQKGPVPVTKGTIRPYEEVIGEYKDSYIESSERMQLPKDLQQIVQSYFSSIEK